MRVAIWIKGARLIDIAIAYQRSFRSVHTMASTSARIRLLLNDARMATLSNDSWADRKNHIRTVRIRTLAGASTLALSSRVRAISEDYLGRPSDSDPHHEHPASAGSALEAERLCRRPGHRCTNAHIEASGHIFKGRAMANVPFKRLYGDSVRDVECRRSMTSGTPPPLATSGSQIT